MKSILVNGETYYETTIGSIKKGEFFKFKPTETARVFVRDAYCRFDKTYEYYPFDDVCDFHFAKKTRKVYVGFAF